MAACNTNENSTSDKDKYTVTFAYNYSDAGNYKEVEVSTDADGFTIVDEPTDPTRTNYEFKGWYTDSSCTTAVDFENNIESNVTYYAKWEQTAATVTFDNNYEGGGTTTETVKIGSAVSQPASPSRTGYTFDNWYVDKSYSATYDFSTAVTGDFSLYAKWNELAAGAETVTITYKYNYDGAPSNGTYDTVEIEKNKKTTAPSPTRDGYLFDGWYTEDSCTTSFDFSGRVTTDNILYAKWLKIQVFEAEMCDWSNFVGFGYSGGVNGWNAVYLDNYNADASNGYFVTGLYDNGLSVEFNIQSDKEVDDAILVLRLSGEYSSFTLSDDEFLTTINGNKVSFGNFSFDITGVSGTDKLKFTDFKSTSRVHLNKGNNVIKLTVDCDRKGIGGTMYALAPMLDCIKVCSTSEVTWGEGYPLDTYLTQHS